MKFRCDRDGLSDALQTVSGECRRARGSRP